MNRFVKFLTWTLGICVILGIILRLTLFDVWTIPDDPVLNASLLPTMGSGDTVLVLTRGTPTLGDLVRCADPEDASRFVVGRIAGFGGDTVEIKHTSLTINGTRFDSREACVKSTFTVANPQTGHETKLNCSRVEMGGGWHFRGHDPKLNKAGNDKQVVGAGRVYLLSDNRAMHDDSRDFGTIPEENCKQRVVFRLWGPSGWSDSDRRMTVIR